MSYTERPNHLEFVVSWPVQGVMWFRTRDSELVLSHVYWLWIFDALSRTSEREHPLSFIEEQNRKFQDPANLVETLPVTPALLEAVRKVDPTTAPAFDLLVPAEGNIVPTPEQILTAFERIVAEALPTGTIEMEID